MRSHFLISAALLLALGHAVPASAEVLTMPPSNADSSAEAADDAFVSIEDISPAVETGSSPAVADEDAFVTLDSLSPGDENGSPTDSEAAATADMMPVATEGGMATEEGTPQQATEQAPESDGQGGKFQRLLTPPAEPIDTPRRGLSMDQVEQLYGRPDVVDPPVGDPPITRWDYPDYSVYFEYNYVIDSVIKR